jgi:hypothetical protein
MAIPRNLRTHTVEDVTGRLINMVADQQLAPGLQRAWAGRGRAAAPPWPSLAPARPGAPPTTGDLLAAIRAVDRIRADDLCAAAPWHFQLLALQSRQAHSEGGISAQPSTSH